MANTALKAVEPPFLAQALEASLDPRRNKEGKLPPNETISHPLTSLAELKIRAEELKPGFSLVLLQITASTSFPPSTRLASALFFKNFIKRYWTDEDGNYKLPQQEVASIKSELIGLMVSVPPSIQSQLGEAISVIADSDFWQRWDTLVNDLVSRLSPDNHVVNSGVLQVAHSIFSRWRPLFRSDELFTEVNHVLSKFAAPYMSLLQSLDACIEKDKSNKVALQQDFTELDLAVQLFYDLSCQDLPPQFEDAMSPLADLLLKYLRFDNKLLHTDNESESGPLENVKAGIFEGLTLYVQKYYDAFGPYVKRFVENSWELLTTVGLESKYDVLVSKALNFLTSTTSNMEQAKPFNDNNVLAQVVEKVILPNLSLRDSDIEMFEDEPIEFIRRDLEGSDSETRRRAATDFLRKLMEQFESPVTTVVSSYVQQYLAMHSKNPKANWRAKDTAVYLFCSIAAKGTPTAAKGVTQTNSLVDVGDFFSNNLAVDLTGPNIEPLLKVDAIKYLYLFRSIITKEQWQQAMPLLVNRLGDSNYVVYTYAAIAVERVLYLADENGKPLIDPAHITPLSKDLLEHLFSLIEQGGAPEKVQENEFLMRCVMRVLIVIKEGVLPITDIVLQHLVSITNIIYRNPSNPRFYYYHFESIGALIR
jgi:exportin-2 (importin alpha re-exporter)